MGNCSSLKLLNKKSRKKVVLLLLGLEGSGKTTIAKGLAGELQNGVVPTVGFSSVTLTFKMLSVVLYDLGGGPGIRNIWNNYFADAHGLVFVLDAADRDRLKESRDILMSILSNDKLSGKPLLVLGNKQDIPGAFDEIDIVEMLDLEKLVNEHRCPTLLETCSALALQKPQKKDDLIIQNSFKWLLSLIERDFEQLNRRVEQDMAVQIVKDQKEMKDKLKRLNLESNPQVESNESTWKNGRDELSSMINSHRSIIDSNVRRGSSHSGRWTRDSPIKNSRICCLFTRRKCCMWRPHRTAPLECKGECSTNGTSGGDNNDAMPLWTIRMPKEASGRTLPLAAPSTSLPYPESPFEIGEISERRSPLQTMKG